MAVQTLGHVRRLAGLWAVCGVVFALSTPVQAAESIRVLMASDVHRLDVRAESVVWLTDGQSRSHSYSPVSYTHLRAHETVLDLVCRLLLEKQNNNIHAQVLTYILHIPQTIVTPE